MRVEPLIPDAATAQVTSGDADAFRRAIDALGSDLAGANRAEDDFARGAGTLEAAVYERARADVALSVATATATRVVQAVASLLNMQI